MALNDILGISNEKKAGLSEERIKAVMPVIRQYVAFWREYPDLFVDFLQTGADFTRKKNFEFFFYQRVNKGPFTWRQVSNKNFKSWEPLKLSFLY